MARNHTKEERERLEKLIEAGTTFTDLKHQGYGDATIIRAQKRVKGRTAPEVPLEVRVNDVLKGSNKKFSIEELSDVFNVGVSRIKQAVEKLHGEGKNIVLTDGVELMKAIPQAPATQINISKFKGKTIRFGLTSDNHLGSKYARMDVLNALFDIWQDQGIDTVYQCGNMIDGEAKFNKFDLLVHGVENQVDYFVEHWPQRKGISTQFVTGDDHEGWYTQREGLDVGRMIQERSKGKREDLQYLGHMEHDLILKAKKGQSVLRLIHAGGGSAYATSYAPQKIVESYQGGEKPQILLVGHYHKAEYGYPREVHVVQAACTEDQTPFMRKNKIQAHVGGWTISFEVDDEGIIHGFTPQFHPFYDRGFYEKKQWAYHWKK